MTTEEREQVQKETNQAIKSIIKKAKIYAKNSNNYHMAKYGKPELVGKQRIKYKTQTMPSYRSQMLKTMIQDDSESLLSKPVKTSNKLMNEPVKTDIKYKTSDAFYQKGSSSKLIRSRPNLPRPNKPQTLTVNDWMKAERIQSLTTNLTLPDNLPSRGHERAKTSQMSAARSSSQGIRTVDSSPWVVPRISPISSQANMSRKATPYQNYKIEKAKKRHIFTSQLIPSKNKILRPNGSAYSGTEYCKWIIILSVNIASQHHTLLEPKFVVTKNGEKQSRIVYMNKKTPFIDMLGVIDPSLKQKTLYQFNRINKIRNIRQSKSQTNKKQQSLYI